MSILHPHCRRVKTWTLELSLWLSLILLLGLPSLSSQASVLGERALPVLSPSEISQLVSTPDPVKNVDPANPSSHLSKILIPRPADSENNTLVRNYIVSTLKTLNWDIEEDTFTETTPYGAKSFTNVIATKDPSAARRVILSAHFDSKFFSTYPMNQFVGATDSAAPCAMMLDLAETLDPLLDRRKERLEAGVEEDDDIADTTLQLVFFDGEEAFKEWTTTDSVYGARHLAEKWSTTYISPHAKRRLVRPSETEISTIEHLILLDLLGAPLPTIRSAFLDTAWLFDSMASAERRLADSGAFAYGDEDTANQDWFRSFFVPRREGEGNVGYIDDDHASFLRKGVSVLHIIANPFPRVWHTLRDDASALDIPTMRRWNLILRVFMSEYLGLRPETVTTRSNHEQKPNSEQVSHIELIRI